MTGDPVWELARLDWIMLRNHLGDETVNELIEYDLLMPVKPCEHGELEWHFMRGMDETCPGGIRDET